MSKGPGFSEFATHFHAFETVGMSLDLTGLGMRDEERAHYAAQLPHLLKSQRELEEGGLKNPTEARQVGHYWLRNPSLAPSDQLRSELESVQRRCREFPLRLRRGGFGTRKLPCRRVLWIGIGGSSLGPQLLVSALAGHASEGPKFRFVDNTDPDGIARVLGGVALERTLVVVASKSGTTSEVQNGLEACRAAFDARGLPFAEHAIAVTGLRSPMAERARRESWLEVFPIPEWVGGRTSLCSAVGLLALELLGESSQALLDGAKKMDELTRESAFGGNPAALMAAAWHHATEGRARRAMVLLPYADSLSVLGRYLQQLVMESIGKRHDLAGSEVFQGLTVYGNKGTSDQHALVQQLREGPDDFFAVFIEVLQQVATPFVLEDGLTLGDHLRGALLGTQAALNQAGRKSMILSLRRVDGASLGALVALFERAVGFYADLIGVNAYDQPGVEAGKQACKRLLAFQHQLLAAVDDEGKTAEELAACAGAKDRGREAFYLLRGLSLNQQGVRMEGGPQPTSTLFRRDRR